MIFFSQIYLISIDGAFQYIPVAKLFAWGEYREAINQLSTSILSFFNSILSKVIGNLEVSGQIISIITSHIGSYSLISSGKIHIWGDCCLLGRNLLFLKPGNASEVSRCVKGRIVDLLALFCYLSLLSFFETKRNLLAFGLNPFNSPCRDDQSCIFDFRSCIHLLDLLP